MDNKFKIITLSGSTRFKKEMEEESRRLTLEGYIVLPPIVYSHSDGCILQKDEEEMLFDMHKQKIAMSDIVHVVNEYGYIGSNTFKEIEYAKSLNKEITYFK